MRKIAAGLLLAAGLWSCNSNDNQEAAYGKLLRQAPYAALTDSIKEQPGNDYFYFQRAILLNKDGQAAPALDDFRRAWELRREENYALGVSNILAAGKPDSAILFLREAVRELPQSLLLQLSLARAHKVAGQTAAAIAVCDSILANEPNQVNTLMLKAELLEEKNDGAGVIATLEKAYQLLPSNKEIADQLSYKYAEAKNPRALLIADSLIKADTQRIHTNARYVKGLYYVQSGETSKALKAFDETLQHDHRYLNAYIEKGKILLSQKKPEEAQSTFELANRISPAFPDAWYWIGRCQEAAGQKQEARLSYEKAYSLDKSFTEAKEAGEKIK